MRWGEIGLIDANDIHIGRIADQEDTCHMLIHVKRNGEVFGPYSIEEVREYLSVGRLTTSDSAQLEGMSEWIPLTSVPGVQSAPPPVTAGASSQTEAERPYNVEQKGQFGAIALDVGIVWGLTFTGGLLVGVTARSAGEYLIGLIWASWFLGSVGFTIVGCRAKGNRWHHLARVAVGTWLISIVNVILGLGSLGQWLVGSFFVALMMGTGGVVSFAFKRQQD